VFFQKKQSPAEQTESEPVDRRRPYRALPPEAGELSVVFTSAVIRPLSAELVDITTLGIGVRIPGERRAEMVRGDVYQVTIGSPVHPDIVTPVQLRSMAHEEDAWHYGFEFVDVGGLYEQLDDFFVRYLNRRHDERLRLIGQDRIALTMEWEGGRREVQVFDISNGGVGFQLSAQALPAIEQGSRVGVRFRLPGTGLELAGHAALARLTLLGADFVLGLAFDFEEPGGLALHQAELERYIAERQRLREAWNALAKRTA
jgi:c-di-GMP-binding flagellar brake protein YcgR